MKGQQSYQNSSISQHYFAVQPLSLLFPNRHPAAFTLYFEKNLQIIAKHSAPASDPHRYFLLPVAIPHFRLTSDRSLDYQWSIYSQRPPETEEFIETQKISLKNQWNAYLKQGNTVFQSELEFRNVKGRLKYLVVVGKSNQELMDKVMAFMRDKKEVNGEKVEKGIVNEPVGQKNPEEVRKTALENTCAQDMQTDKEKKQVKPADEHVSPAPEQPPHEDLLRKGIDEGMDSLATEPNMLKLSQSQLEICEQIEQEVKQYEHKINAKPQEHQAESIVDPPQRDSIPSRNSLQPVNALPAKEITIVSSQLLNSKQEAVQPLWKNNKIIGLAIILLILLAWLLMDRTDPTAIKPLREKRPRQSKNVQGKEEKQTKKGKTKNKNT